MNDAVAGDERAVLHGDVSCQQGSVRQDDVIAELTVVRDVTVRHEKIIRADDGVFRGRVSAMGGEMFAKHVVSADPQSCRGILVFEVLRRIADDTARVKDIVRADKRRAREVHVGSEATVRAERYVFVDDRIGPHICARIHLRPRMDDGGLMNHGAESSHGPSALSSCKDIGASREQSFRYTPTSLALRRAKIHFAREDLPGTAMPPGVEHIWGAVAMAVLLLFAIYRRFRRFIGR